MTSFCHSLLLGVKAACPMPIIHSAETHSTQTTLMAHGRFANVVTSLSSASKNFYCGLCAPFRCRNVCISTRRRCEKGHLWHGGTHTDVASQASCCHLCPFTLLHSLLSNHCALRLGKMQERHTLQCTHCLRDVQVISKGFCASETDASNKIPICGMLLPPGRWKTDHQGG